MEIKNNQEKYDETCQGLAYRKRTSYNNDGKRRSEDYNTGLSHSRRFITVFQRAGRCRQGQFGTQRRRERGEPQSYRLHFNFTSRSFAKRRFCSAPLLRSLRLWVNPAYNNSSASFFVRCAFVFFTFAALASSAARARFNASRVSRICSSVKSAGKP